MNVVRARVTMDEFERLIDSSPSLKIAWS